MPSDLPTQEGDDKDFDLNAVVDDIAGDITEKVEPPPANTPPKDTPPIDPVALIPEDMPKAWPKENGTMWTGLTPEVRAYINKREGQVSQGIQMYQEGHAKWQKVLEPFQETLQQHPNVDPVGLIHNLMNSHLRLLYLPQEQKVQFAAKLLQAYGIEDFNGVKLGDGGQNAALQRVASVEQTLQSMLLAENRKQVDAFFADPQNKYASDVASDMMQLIQQGQATDLKDAYEKAVWLNPGVRQKLLNDAYTTKKREEQEEALKRRKLNGMNVNSTPDGGTPPAKKGTVDDTVNEVLSKFSGQH